MGKTKIEWCDWTWNPWIGCTKVSPGCSNCYAEHLMDKRLGRVQWGDQGTRSRTSDAYWKGPLKWNAKLEGTGRRERVFCASLADVFERTAVNHDSQVADWRFDLWDLIDKSPNLDWLLLTKRPENILDVVPWSWHNQRVADQSAWRRGSIKAKWPTNVWTGASIENQKVVERLPELCKVPGRHFLSIEPLLGPINLGDLQGIDWVIIGGESGPNVRPMKLAWVEDILAQCRAANIPMFLKQLGTSWAKANDAAHSKGGEPDEWPAHLRVRMMPGEVWNE